MSSRRSFDFTRFRKDAPSLSFIDAVFSDAVFNCAVDFSGAVFDGERGANFIEASFLSEEMTSFGGARFKGAGGVNFRMAKFGGPGVTNFSRAAFSGGAADFTWAKFMAERGVDFKLTDFSGEGAVDFHFAEFTGKIANFTGGRFGKDGGANFSLIQFAGGDGANFSSTKFTGKGQASFSATNFSGRGGANFNKAEFSCEEGANFSLAQLTGKSKANFVDATFSGDGPVNFSRARFSGGSGADFRGAEFSCPGVSFAGATFTGEGRILFGGRTFSPGTIVDFQDVSFQSPDRVTFDSVDLGRTRFLFTDVTKIDFTKVSWGGRRYNSSLFSGRVKVFDELFQERGRILRLFQRLARRLEIGELFLALVERLTPKTRTKEGPFGSYIKRTHRSLLVHAKLCAARKEENHWWVYRLYNQLMVNYTSAFRSHEAGDFFAGQMEMRRRESFENPLTRIGLWFFRIFSLFGERPAYALVWLILACPAFGTRQSEIGDHGFNARDRSDRRGRDSGIHRCPPARIPSFRRDQVRDNLV